MDKLYIVIPAYNEEENIEQVIRQWYPFIDSRELCDSEGSRLVIADSCSTDNTHKIVSEMKVLMPKIEILSDTSQYHGPKVIALYKYAILNGADYIFQTDGDGQTNPEEFLSFWKDRHSYDGVFGYRKCRKDGKDRIFVSRIVCILVRIFFEVDIPDANAPFRLMSAGVLKKYIGILKEDYNIPNIILTSFFARFDKVAFKEITFKPRSAGKNSINIPKIISIGLGAIPDFMYFKKRMRMWVV